MCVCLALKKNKGAPVFGQPKEREISKREMHYGDERGRQAVEAQLFLHKLQNAGQCDQVQTRPHTHSDRNGREPVHDSRAVQVHRVRQDLFGLGHQRHLFDNALHTVRRRRGRGHEHTAKTGGAQPHE